MTLAERIAALPLVAILRGIAPDEAAPVVEALAEEGFLAVEVPLNSPSPAESIRRLSARFGDRLLIGAGTVVDAAQVPALAEAGARFAVAPNADPAVIRAAKAAGLYAVPGVLTPTEAFAALAAGADALKLFPAEMAPPPVLRALKAVLPADAAVLPVGGIVPETMAGYRRAGAFGFGLGSALYRPGDGPDAVRARARAFVRAWAEPAA